MIGGYLEQLDRELRARRAPRRRFLAEASDHLHASAEELGDEGEAVARFGDPSTVAARFAEAAAATSARRSTLLVALAFAACVAAVGAFRATAGPEFVDFPQGAPTTFALLVAGAAAGLALARRLRPGAIVAGAAALAGGLALEVVAALTRPAGILPWNELPLVLTLFGLAVVLAAATAAWAAIAALRVSSVTKAH